MGNWANRTSTMITITIFLLLLVATTGLYAGYTNFIVQEDARIINELGKIRGGVQRLVHFVLMGTSSYEMYEEIEAIIAGFREHPQLAGKVSELEDTWQALREAAGRYEALPSREGHEEIFRLGEELWILSNDLVLTAQLHAQGKIENYNYIVASFVVCIILIGALLVWLKQYVHDSLEFLARHDSLTKAANKWHFQETLRAARASAQKQNQPLSLIILDIDHFKHVNDNFGHSLGDRVLEQLTAVFRAHLEEGQLLARVGGEEFAVIAPQTDLAGGLRLAERLRQAVAEATFPGVGKVTISLGAAELMPEEDEEGLFRRADAALYCAKAGGRNQTAG